MEKVKKFIAYLPGVLKEYHAVFTGNVIAQQRLKGVGVLSKEDAISYGATVPRAELRGGPAMCARYILTAFTTR